MNFIRKSFTLIELLVAVFVFVILFLITASFVNLAAGSAKSLHIKMLTNDMRNAMDTISQKMNTANAKVTVGADEISGFGLKGSVLGVATKNPSSGNKCVYFGKNDDALSMFEDDCTGSWPNNAGLTQNLTGKNIVVTQVDFTYSANPPLVTTVIKAHDKDPKYEADNTIEIKTTYTMDYLTIKQLQ